MAQAIPAIFRVHPPISIERVHTRPELTKAVLLFADALALVLSVSISIGLKWVGQPDLQWSAYLRLWPFLFVFLMVYKIAGLYAIVGLTRKDEIRRGAISSAILFVLLGAATVSFRSAQHPLTWTLFVAIGISVAMHPWMRSMTRSWLSGKAWWGYSAVIFGSGSAARKIVQILADDPSLNLKPIACVDPRATAESVHGIPIVAQWGEVAEMLPLNNNLYGVYAAEDMTSKELTQAVDSHRSEVAHSLVVPRYQGLLTPGMHAKSLGGRIALELAS